MNRWTEAENLILTQKWSELDDRELAHIIGRSINAIRCKRRRLCFIRKSGKAKYVDGFIYPSLTSEKAYIMGVLCGDGSLFKTYSKRDRCYIYGISLNAKDKDFVEYFQSKVKTVYGPESQIYKSSNQWQFILQSKQAYFDLIRYGTFKTEDWRVPSEILQNKDDAIKISFIQGFFDSDGFLSDEIVGFANTNLEGLKQVQQMLYGLGIISNLRLSVQRGTKSIIRGLEVVSKKDCFLLATESKFGILRFIDTIGIRIKRKVLYPKKIETLRKWVSEEQKKYKKYKTARKLHERGLGSARISQILELSRDMVHHWLYSGRKPYFAHYIEKMEGLSR